MNLGLLFLAFQSISSKVQIFNAECNLNSDTPFKLFNIGLMTNVLNPKMAIFYLSFFPQFINPDHGPIYSQGLQLGLVQIVISFTINFLIVVSAAQVASWFSEKPIWVRIHKWFMASVLTGLAIKMALTKVK